MDKRVKFPLALKLVLLNTTLAVFALAVLMTLATYFIRLDVQLAAEQSNHAINSQAADIAVYEFSSKRDNVSLFVTALSAIGFDDLSIPYFTDLFFDGNEDIAVVCVPDVIEFINTDFFDTYEVDAAAYENFLLEGASSIERAIQGEQVALNSTLAFGVPSIALLQPWESDGKVHALITIFSVEALAETFGSGTTNLSYLINDKNEVLIHPDVDFVYSTANMSKVTLVEQMRQNNDSNRQIVFIDDNTEYFGSYTKIPIGDIAIITTIESNLVFEGVDATLYQNTMLAMAILFVLIMLMRFFSTSITKPVTLLTEASEQIEKGNFSIDLKPQGNDEVGLLTSRFISMCKGLESFGRFVNMDIALKAIKGDLELGGVVKDVTVVFSDIRNFTSISEKLEATEVVLFLNEYMSKMEECVTSNKGTVDKYIGDAIMAVWGASSTEGNNRSDALNSIRSALLMRAALIDFNEGRGSESAPLIKFGCGINSGPAVAGQMGSLKHMEYTIIGDTVNLASRTEALTKIFATDILIAENTYELVKDEVVVEKMPSVSVKGKKNPVAIYAVINMPKETSIPGAGSKGPKTLQEVRSILGLKEPDFKNVDVNEEERKYKID